MRSATVIASSWSWVTITKVMPEPLLQVHQLELGLLAQLLVERRQRLVEQQDARTLGQRARQRDPLALAAGQLVRLAARRSLSSCTSASISSTRARDLGSRQALLLEPEGDVAGDGEMRETARSSGTSC